MAGRLFKRGRHVRSIGVTTLAGPVVIVSLLMIAPGMARGEPQAATAPSQRPSATAKPAKPSAAKPAKGTPTAKPAKAAQPAQAATKPGSKPKRIVRRKRAKGGKLTLERFLDRLMIAESGGRAFAKNPRSSALGPFQFINATFLDIARRHFKPEIASLPDEKLLALRTNIAYARRAAEAFTRENAAYLTVKGVKPTFRNLRLAFLLGPTAATRLLKSDDALPLASVLSAEVIAANPFMTRLTVAGLKARTDRELAAKPRATAGLTPTAAALAAARLRKPAKPRGPVIKVRCDLRRPSCKRWLALKRKALTRRAGRNGARARVSTR
ncbi:MAG: hypothetical protein AAFR04_14325 [Pseudomonadota bacterium]